MKSFYTAITCLFLFVSCAALFASCKKEDKGPKYRVTYEVTLKGNYATPNPVVVYHDAAGTSHTETLSPGVAWKKEYNVDKGYSIFISLKGDFAAGGGEAGFIVEGYKGSELIEVADHSNSHDNAAPFSLEYTARLDEE